MGDVLLESGFIKIYRSILSWEWYSDANTSRLFLHLLLTVNYENRKWQGKTILRGQRLTSVSKLVTETGLSTKNVRTSLGKLKETGEVAVETANKYSLITIVNYNNFQGSEDFSGKQDGEQLANERQTDGKQGANKGQQCKKDKENKKYNTSFVPAESETEEKTGRKYIFSQEHMQLAEQLKFRILEHKPNFKYPDNLGQWANTIRLMIEQDNRAFDEITAVINWCQKDSFWQSNILGANKLREKFDQLQAKMNSISTNTPKKTLTQRTFDELSEVCAEYDRRNAQKAARQDDGQLPWSPKH